MPKLGFVLCSIQDIALRGTFSKSFISPNLYETNGPTTVGSASNVDLGAGQENAHEVNGANPALDNVRVDSYIAGIMISPRQMPGLTLNGGVFHAEETNAIGYVSDITIITSVNTLGPASPFAGLVHKGGLTGPTVTAPGQLEGNLPLYYIDDSLSNLGDAQRVGGVDLGAYYTRNFGAAGLLSLGVDGTYYLQYRVQASVASKFYDVIGYYSGLAGEAQPYHLTPQVSCSVGGFTASAIGNYLPSVRDAHEISIDPTPGAGGTDPDKPSAILASQ